MVNFQNVSVDKTTWQATIGPGARLGDVTQKLHDMGGRAFAHGVCPGVGLGGHATIVRQPASHLTQGKKYTDALFRAALGPCRVCGDPR